MASTADSVYLIGGFVGDNATPSSTIARYAGDGIYDFDGFWTEIGDLRTKVRFKINLFSTLIIYWKSYLAGSPSCGKLRRPTYGDWWWTIRYTVSTLLSKKTLYLNSRMPIEIWNEDFTEGSDIGYTFPSGQYGYGMSAFLVPPGFCSKIDPFPWTYNLLK